MQQTGRPFLLLSCSAFVLSASFFQCLVHGALGRNATLDCTSSTEDLAAFLQCVFCPLQSPARLCFTQSKASQVCIACAHCQQVLFCPVHGQLGTLCSTSPMKGHPLAQSKARLHVVSTLIAVQSICFTKTSQACVDHTHCWQDLLFPGQRSPEGHSFAQLKARQESTACACCHHQGNIRGTFSCPRPPGTCAHTRCWQGILLPGPRQAGHTLPTLVAFGAFFCPAKGQLGTHCPRSQPEELSVAQSEASHEHCLCSLPSGQQQEHSACSKAIQKHVSHTCC